ncbi:hypothetical protein RND81_05G244600 [Saponaria officinalis]|uniref:Uncharacterized protein n=1 Tax=Saponaria officinalis TaxID=3572 RepID=A0AAW1L0G9_SAPOF
MASFYSDAFLKKIPLKSQPPTTTTAATTTTTPHPNRRKIHIRKRGRQPPTIHLGGGKKPRGFFLTKLFRRARLKWLKLSVFRKLKQYYKALIRDVIEASASVEAYQQRMLMETSLATVPGISFSSFHGGSTLRNAKSIFI